MKADHPQRFEYNSGSYLLIRISSGRPVMRSAYLLGQKAWQAWFEIVLNGGDDPYKIRSQYRAELYNAPKKLEKAFGARL